MRIQGTKPSISDVAIPEQKNGTKGHRTVWYPRLLGKIVLGNLITDYSWMANENGLYWSITFMIDIACSYWVISWSFLSYF